MQVADFIFQRLKREVDTIFYLTGGMCATLVDALGQSGLQAVECLHEQGAGFAAVGYSQIHGFGVCLTTSGPGATNAMTPCLAAWMDSIPVLFLSGTVMTDWMALPNMRSRGTQEGKTIEMVKPITKWALTAESPTICLSVLENMIDGCKSDRRGPCWLEITQDIQNAII